MLRVTRMDGKTDYMPTTRMRAVLDEQGNDRTDALLARRTYVGKTPSGDSDYARKKERVGPRSVTRAYVISETSLLGRVTFPSTEPGDRKWGLAFDLGMMHNVSERMGVGASGFFGAGSVSDYGFVDAGARLRLLRWMTPTSYVEMAPGIILGEDRPHGDAVSPGYSLQANFSPKRNVTLTVEAVSLQRWEDQYHTDSNLWTVENIEETAVFFGARFGGLPGLIGGAVTAAAVFVTEIGLIEADGPRTVSP